MLRIAHLIPFWRGGGVGGRHGALVLLLLPLWLTMTTLPQQRRSLRAPSRAVAESFRGAVAARLGGTVAADGSRTRDSRTSEGLILPSEEFFREPRTAGGSGNAQLEIAWLMSFPNSGTSYTITLIRHLTLTSTATNYGHELEDGRRESEPVFGDQPDGPFWYEPRSAAGGARGNYTRPARFVFTKTHCGLRCEKCPPQSYVETTFSFRRACLSGGRVLQNGTKVAVTYGAPRVARAVHLVRDPFDNVVSRFHLERRKPTGQGYENSKEGFLEFCNHMNSAYDGDEQRAQFLDQSLLAMLQDIPCRADFIRYIEWHNLAFSTTTDMGLDTMVVHYDWYETRFVQTAADLVAFLGLEAKAEPEPFVAGKVYGDYFTDEQRSCVKLAYLTMASQESWAHLGHYFN